MKKPEPALVSRSALRFSALGAEPRLQILRLLLAAHPEGMVAGEVQEELGIPASTLSRRIYMTTRRRQGFLPERWRLHWGVGILRRWRNCRRVRWCWTWGRVAELMCCFRPSVWGRLAKHMGWT